MSVSCCENYENNPYKINSIVRGNKRYPFALLERSGSRNQKQILYKQLLTRGLTRPRTLPIGMQMVNQHHRKTSAFRQSKLCAKKAWAPILRCQLTVRDLAVAFSVHVVCEKCVLENFSHSPSPTTRLRNATMMCMMRCSQHDDDVVVSFITTARRFSSIGGIYFKHSKKKTTTLHHKTQCSDHPLRCRFSVVRANENHHHHQWIRSG